MALEPLLRPRLADGTWFKLRHAFPRPLPMLRALRRRRAPDTDAHRAQRVVIVGLGAAALACLRTLTRAGFTNVTVVARDALFGGKCVNSGCMPTEFILAHPELSPSDQRSRLIAFTAALRADLAAEFQTSGARLIQGEAARVRGTDLLLADGQTLPFDRLAVATGSIYPIPKRIAAAAAAAAISVEDFWQLHPGSRLAIHAEHNIAALSLGHVAKRLGLVPTVLLSGRNPAAALPSFRYFVRTLAASGVTIVQDARLIAADAAAITYEAARATHTLDYNHLLIASRPTPRFLDIDGATPTIFDIDLTSAALPSRPDIVFLGDGAGYFTAAEAEAQARMVARHWITGQRVDLAALAQIPLSLDGPAPLAMRGPPWTLARRDWEEIDFRAIGWTKVNGQDGKLWYLLDRATACVEAIHICHPHAKDLIALAGTLMAHPITHQSWRLNTLHPTSAEIFAALADHATTRLTPTAPPANTPTSATFHLPDLPDLTPAGPHPIWLSPANAVAALSSPNPRRHLAAAYAVAHLTGHPTPIRIVPESPGAYTLQADGALIEEDPPAQLCTAEQGGNRVYVRY